jgi:hypothetical protein
MLRPRKLTSSDRYRLCADTTCHRQNGTPGIGATDVNP